jgi:hypothetical protein
MTAQETIDRGAATALRAMPGARVTYGLIRLYCSRHRTFAENAQTAVDALVLLTGKTVQELTSDESPTLTIEAYRSS